MHQLRVTYWGAISLALVLATGDHRFVALAGNTLTIGDVGVLENRFFSHQYLHDPVEKRLERLECLVFGGTQAGTNEERLKRLLASVATKPDTHPNDSARGKVKAPPPASTPKTTSPTSGQYPVLNTLEWRALKKTYPAESLDQRLDRLENKLFGQPAETMAYSDRVERLKKTLGIGIETQPRTPNIARGPMPRARARAEDAVPSEGPFGQQLLPSPSQELPFGFGNTDPFGMSTIFGTTFDRQMHRMMEEMHRQMAEARRLGPGSWQFDPQTGEWMEQRSGRRLKPGELRTPPPPRQEPPLGTPKPIHEVPPYADPNSI